MWARGEVRCKGGERWFEGQNHLLFARRGTNLITCRLVTWAPLLSTHLSLSPQSGDGSGVGIWLGAGDGAGVGSCVGGGLGSMLGAAVGSGVGSWLGAGVGWLGFAGWLTAGWLAGSLASRCFWTNIFKAV